MFSGVMHKLYTLALLDWKEWEDEVYQILGKVHTCIGSGNYFDCLYFVVPVLLYG